MGFQTRKGLEFFFKKFETKYHSPLPFSFFSFFSPSLFLFFWFLENIFSPLIFISNDIKIVQFG